MAQYIDKSAVVAEIESKKNMAQILGDNAINGSMQQFYDGMKQGCIDILSFLDALEVKEVDDEKCKEYDKAISIAKAWYKSSDSSAQERNVARMIIGDKVREEL
jgi:hypothetical protein